MRQINIDVRRVLGHQNQPVTADELRSKMQVNKTTVYRQLLKFVESGQVLEVDFGDGKKRYELASLGHHHHVICQKCHRITCVDLDDDLSVQEADVSAKSGFKISHHLLEFFGLCANCQP